VPFSQTQSLIADIEAMTGARLITWWNFASGSICNNDVLAPYGVV